MYGIFWAGRENRINVRYMHNESERECLHLVHMRTEPRLLQELPPRYACDTFYIYIHYSVRHNDYDDLQGNLPQVKCRIVMRSV